MRMTMDASEFERHLAETGFGKSVPGEYEPNQVNPPHTHPFEVRGLILRGEMTITPVGGTATRYRPGEVFVMPLAAVHQEQVGPEGCAYRWGKREPSSSG
jgi:uncharacterized cupin superfamily protein